MDAYTIGKLIKEFRIRNGYSQEELCYGLCAVSTLSRIERGDQVPSKKTAEAFLSRLGVSTSSSYIVMNNVDFDRWNLEQQMTQAILSDDCDIGNLIKEYESLGEMDNLERQKILFFKTICENHHENDKQAVLSHFVEALQLSIPNFRLGEEFSFSLLTETERLILNNIAIAEFELGNIEEAIRIEEFLRNYYGTKSTNSLFCSTNLPVILFNLSNWYETKGDYEKSIEAAAAGKKVCIKFGQLDHFPLFVMNSGWAYGKLGDMKKCKSDIDYAIKTLVEMEKFELAEEQLRIVQSEFPDIAFEKISFHEEYSPVPKSNANSE